MIESPAAWPSRPRLLRTLLGRPRITGLTQGISRRDSEGRSFVPIIAVLAFTILGLFFLAAPANAEPAKITEAKQEGAALRERVERLGMQVEQAAEDMAYAQWQLEQTKVAIDAVSYTHLTLPTKR